MSFMTIGLALVTVGLFAYLIFALLEPQRF
ncbi:K+-transporting ATPase subunit F [Bordetella trematum]|uniref:K+-transporting ATPase, F subunit n=1 Tax=Bordetella trematum TaxID=123899 RepID=A0A157PBP7_9BORD|nr:K(+)-transporting ATPase subunit F [Bordetella trematum]AUL46003.1 potassium-transporting ATPase subunit F [Bordetella trematum]AZR92756.1 K+-transporting ATPase subunit F [Bordetella trematum]NNH18035.1 K(+)-transporting ATPase subunit F [Bordetella trematum]QIM71363.1 K(+)-transporting ATPase subunit F [Bordetella trematum]SAI30329.1 K+-transporting ATPase%2C F subunit [Bordetella trematum]